MRSRRSAAVSKGVVLGADSSRNLLEHRSRTNHYHALQIAKRPDARQQQYHSCSIIAPATTIIAIIARSTATAVSLLHCLYSHASHSRFPVSVQPCNGSSPGKRWKKWKLLLLHRGTGSTSPRGGTAPGELSLPCLMCLAHTGCGPIYLNLADLQRDL